MENMLEELEYYFRNTPKEEILKGWSKYAEYDKVGPKVNEYLEHLETHFKIPKQEHLEKELQSSQILNESPKFFSGFLFRFVL